ncbi:Bgt-3647 [Blumeria graminis f. sp. tritici]|uniref:mRNA stability protein n=2 Tax=Blumeria graminis f. sp. tritici TaxID=62690 RepID=A0A061HCM5_BLUGR|nr:hypothetical protein BGT96224_3647 [Blumeria graminis f. sp. tritici 96224]VCU40945.1 Bgt-3647 [Blumeria graminis f. sp. tritici]
MNPHQKSKIDVSKLSPDEQRLFRLYGKIPSKANHLAKIMKDRKYFDSGDYALSKAGKADSVDTGSVGSQHPVPENIPHLSSPSIGSGGQIGSSSIHHITGTSGLQCSSPIKESSNLNREMNFDQAEDTETKEATPAKDENTPLPVPSVESLPSQG